MKKIFGLALATAFIATSCKEEFKDPASLASLAVIHASPVAATAPTDTLHVFVDDGRYTPPGGITYLGNSVGPYLPLDAGSQTINIRRKNVAASDLYVAPFTYDFDPAGAYSFFVYDTTTSATSQAKVLRLKDDLTLPVPTNSHVRFLHLAPTAAAVDVTLLRTSITPNDSVTITNKAYVGGAPDEAALAAFTPVPRGVYTAKIKAAGTQTVLTTVAADMSRGTDVTQGGIFTIYASGTAKGRPLAGRILRHY